MESCQALTPPMHQNSRRRPWSARNRSSPSPVQNHKRSPVQNHKRSPVQNHKRNPVQRHYPRRRVALRPAWGGAVAPLTECQCLDESKQSRSVLNLKFVSSVARPHLRSKESLGRQNPAVSGNLSLQRQLLRLRLCGPERISRSHSGAANLVEID